MRSAVAVVALWVLAVGGAAEEVDHVGAKGTFQSGDITFNVGDAYAYRSQESGTDRAVVTVVVSNVGILEKHIDRWLDRKQVFEKRFKDDQTAAIYFDFSPEGTFRGISYYLNSGNGCGYCSGGDVQSQVKLTGGRLTGPFSYKGKDRSWDITLDVPVAPDNYGAPLPAGGGEPGKAYLAFAAAVKGRDAAALKKVLVSRRLQGMAQAEKAGQIEDFLSFVAEKRYVDTVRVVKGFATADRAILSLQGEGPVGKRVGQVLLLKEATGWRVDDEILDIAWNQ